MDPFDIIPADYQPSQRATIKLKVNAAKPGRKYPDVTGFICITQDWLDRAAKSLVDAAAKGEHTAFVSVALWDTVGEYTLTGSVEVQLSKGRYDVPAQLKDNPQTSDWY